MKLTFEEAVDFFGLYYSRIPNLPLGELPEYLVHRFPELRSQARRRLEEIEWVAQGRVLTEEQRLTHYGIDGWDESMVDEWEDQ